MRKRSNEWEKGAMPKMNSQNRGEQWKQNEQDYAHAAERESSTP
jgi:hypothetical protein